MIREIEPFNIELEILNLVKSCFDILSPEDSQHCVWFKNYAKYHAMRIAFDYKIIKENVKKDSKILEFGSIPLLLTAALVKKNYRITGLDIDPGRFKVAIDNLGIKVIKCDIEQELLPIDNNKYDVVIFNELFEHLRINPNFTMREVYRILKPSGMLILSTPNLRSLKGIINFLIFNYAFSSENDVFKQYEKIDNLGHMGHVREYTSREIIDFLDNSGFIVDKLIYRGGTNSRKARFIYLIFPFLRPFISCIARK